MCVRFAVRTRFSLVLFYSFPVFKRRNIQDGGWRWKFPIVRNLSNFVIFAMEEASEISQCKVIEEGKAKITFANPNAVFYNPVQVFNRDLSVACIQVYAEELFPLTVKCNKKKQKKRVEKGEVNDDRCVQIDQSNTGNNNV